MLWPTLSTSCAWQSPQVLFATRRSPGFTNWMNSSDSWLSRTELSLGFAELSKNTGLRGLTCACRIVRPGVGSPPWQSVQPRRTNSLPWGSWEFSWQSMHPRLFAIWVAFDWSTLLGFGIAAPAFGMDSFTAIGGPKRLRRSASSERAGRAEAIMTQARRKGMERVLVIRKSWLRRGSRCRAPRLYPRMPRL